ncbi:MAG: helix-turn-helix transcriptional regulator [Bacteroidales bacterium]
MKKEEFCGASGKSVDSYSKRSVLYGDTFEKFPFHPDDVDRVRRSHQFFLRHLLCKDFTITDLARNACMSETKFKKVFRAIFKKPVYKYYQDLRLFYALQLIARDNFSLKQTAAALHYANPQKLSISLRRYFGVPVHELRKVEVLPLCAEPLPLDPLLDEKWLARATNGRP